MNWTLFLILFAIAFVFIINIMKSLETAKIAADQDRAFRGAHRGWELYISPFEKAVLGLNRETAEIMLGTTESARKFKLSSIVSVEVCRDGSSVSATNRGSQIAGAAIGGLALGGIGILIGGLSGSKSSRSTIQSLSIKIIVDDAAAPLHLIEFFRSPNKNGVDVAAPSLKPALANIDRLHALLVGALRAEANTAKSPPPADASMQLSRLWELKLSGALTDEEFSAEKGKLLAGQAGGPTTLREIAPSTDYDVVLTDVASKRAIVPVGTALSEERLDLSMQQVGRLLKQLPTAVVEGVSRSEAERVQGLLQAAGGTVEVRDRTST